MKLIATIAMYVLVTLLLEKQKNTEPYFNLNHSTQERAKIFKQKWKTFSRLMFLKNTVQPKQISKQSLLLKSKSNILYRIVSQFLTFNDVLILQKTCKTFQNLLQPNNANMVTFLYYAESKKKTETTIIWDDLRYFMKESYYSLFGETCHVKMFNIKENQYAICGPEKKIIVWNNSVTHYPEILVQQQLNNSEPQNYYTKVSCYLHYKNWGVRIFNKSNQAWAMITKEGNVKTGRMQGRGNGEDSSMVQSQLKNVKSIVSTNYAFAALLGNGRVVAWGNRQFGGVITPEYGGKKCNDILTDVKMVFSTEGAFAALLNNGRVLAWGNKDYGGKIPEHRRCQLKNVKMIVSTNLAFLALSNDGSIFIWENNTHLVNNQIRLQLQYAFITMISSTKSAFAVLLDDGNVLVWGEDNNHGGKIPDHIQQKLKNVKMIFSNFDTFAALLANGRVLAWGNSVIPDDIQPQLKNVKMIFSTNYAFTALLDNGSVVAWGNEDYGGTIPKNIQLRLQLVKTIIPKSQQFTAFCENGEVFTWPDLN